MEKHLREQELKYGNNIKMNSEDIWIGKNRGIMFRCFM
jgi:hypothetical protein